MTFYRYPDYMYHHGVKGMKWGVRKKIQSVNPNQRTLFGANAVGRNRRAAKQHNIAIKNRVTVAKSKYESAKNSNNVNSIKTAKSELKRAKSARRKNLAGRAATQLLGYTDSGRGSYYRNRQLGRSKVTSALLAYGRQNITHLQSSNAVFAAATLSGEQYLRKKNVLG